MISWLEIRWRRLLSMSCQAILVPWVQERNCFVAVLRKGMSWQLPQGLTGATRISIWSHCVLCVFCANRTNALSGRNTWRVLPWKGQGLSWTESVWSRMILQALQRRGTRLPLKALVSRCDPLWFRPKRHEKHMCLTSYWKLQAPSLLVELFRHFWDSLMWHDLVNVGSTSRHL